MTERVTLSGSLRGLPGSARALLAADTASAVGVGLTQPYLVVLLHGVRGVPVATATAIVALTALVSLIGNPVAGVLIDRFGGRAVMVAGVLTASGGLLGVGTLPGAGPAAVAVATTGLGWSLVLPALATRLATLVPATLHTGVYTLQYALFNAGLGAGAAAAGLTLTQGTVRPLLWVVAAVVCGAAALVAALVRADPARPTAAPDQRGPGYRQVLADRALRRLLLATGLLAAAGYGVFNSAPAVLALRDGDPAALSWLNVANCATIVLGLPVALRVARRITPRAALVVTAGLWAATWAVCVPTGFGVGPTRPALAVAAVLLGAGELLLAGALPTMLNALAPDGLRGRYNALSTLAITGGMASGPLLTAAATGIVGVAWVLPVAVGLATAGGGLLVDRTPTPTPTEAPA